MFGILALTVDQIFRVGSLHAGPDLTCDHSEPIGDKKITRSMNFASGSLEIMPLMTPMNDASAPISGAVAHHTELAPTLLSGSAHSRQGRRAARGGVYR